MTSGHLLTIIDIIWIFSSYISFLPKKHSFSVREFDVLIDPRIFQIVVSPYTIAK